MTCVVHIFRSISVPTTKYLDKDEVLDKEEDSIMVLTFPHSWDQSNFSLAKICFIEFVTCTQCLSGK